MIVEDDNKKALEEVRQNYRSFYEFVEERAADTVQEVAFSIDGRTFGFEAKMSMDAPVGSYTSIRTADGRHFLGQIITKEVVARKGPELAVGLGEEFAGVLPQGLSSAQFTNQITYHVIEGTGVLLDKFDGEKFVSTRNTDVFNNAEIRLADSATVEQYLGRTASSGGGLPIGNALFVDAETPVHLNAEGFGRHTFLCGQSGSGKTFSLGIVLEQLLLSTQLPMVIIDPNSDFTRLGQMRSMDDVNRLRTQSLSVEEYEALVTHYGEATKGLHVYRPPHIDEPEIDRLQVRFGDLDRREQGTVLELDPLGDREEFNSFWRFVEGFEHLDYSLSDVRDAIAHDYSVSARQLGLRIENLDIADWDVWTSPSEPSLIDRLDSDEWRCIAADIGTYGRVEEKLVIANAILGSFWRNRNQRKPVLIVIDEAHNICPQEPASELETIATDYVIRIAGEGRKFGIYLLLASQRPDKIHSNVLSQCDNLILMRMNSKSDLDHLASIMSQVPTSLLDQATHFSLGESLLAGKIVQNPTFTKFSGRFTEEGGSDVPASWMASGD
jgi:hypothetical protein